MPYIVRKGKGSKEFLIVNQKTNSIVGHSDSMDKAYRSIKYREEAEREKGKRRA